MYKKFHRFHVKAVDLEMFINEFGLRLEGTVTNNRFRGDVLDGTVVVGSFDGSLVKSFSMDIEDFVQGRVLTSFDFTDVDYVTGLASNIVDVSL